MVNKKYREILLHAWKLTIKNPYLWILGLLSSFSLNTGIFEAGLQNISGVLKLGQFNTGSSFSLDIYSASLNRIFNTALPNYSNFFIFALMIAIIILFIYITTIAQIVLIKKTHILSLNKKDLTNEMLIYESNENFGSVLVINILSRVSHSLLFLIACIPLILGIANGSNNAIALASVIFFIIFIPFSIILSLVTMFSIIYTVIKKQDVINSIKTGWDIVRNNFTLSAEILLSLLIIKLLAILLIILFASIIFIPIAILITTLLAVHKVIIFGILLVIASILAVIVFGLLNALFATYYISVLTILFQDLTSYKLSSKFIRIYNNIINKFNLTKKQKDEIKELASKNNLPKDEIINVIKNTTNKYMPKLTKIIKDASINIDNLEPTLNQTKINIKKIIEEEAKKLIPTLKRVKKNIESDTAQAYKDAKPKIKKQTKKIITNIEKEYPHLAKIKNELEEKYRAELEKELAKVFVKTYSSKKVKPTGKRKVKKVISKKKA